MEDFLVELGGGGVEVVVLGGQGREDGVPVLWVLTLAGDVGEPTADGVRASAEGTLGSGGEVVGGVVRGASVAGDTRKGVD